MDLLDYDLTHDAEEGVPVHLRDPRTDEPLFTQDKRLVTITVAGMHSVAYREASHAAGRRFVGLPPALLDSPMVQPMREAADIDVLVAITYDWDGIEHDGVPLDFHEKAVAAVYHRFLWIREQVAKAVRNPKVFGATRSDWAPPPAAETKPQPDFSTW